MSRLFDRRREGQVAVGAYSLARGPEYAEVMGFAGLDFVIFDLMVSALSWPELGEMVRAAGLNGATPFVRLPAYPWGGDTVDPHLAADALRAVAIGCEGVLASVNTVGQIQGLVHAAGDHHHKPYLRSQGMMSPFPTQGGDTVSSEMALRSQAEHIRANRVVGPVIESLRAVDELPAMLDVEGLSAVHLALGDLSRELGHPGQYTHPELRALIERVGKTAAERDVLVMVNTSFPMGEAAPADRLQDEMGWLADHGVGAIMIAYPSLVAQWFYERSLQLFRERG